MCRGWIGDRGLAAHTRNDSVSHGGQELTKASGSTTLLLLLLLLTKASGPTMLLLLLLFLPVAIVVATSHCSCC